MNRRPVDPRTLMDIGKKRKSPMSLPVFAPRIVPASSVTSVFAYVKAKKVKQSRYRPGVAQRVPGS